ncbi:hypothetical protein LSAT2_002357 [Lamellibrachia satsuma]|nr:hypothetical protein LSAT2_002357 [Lamellibrachia satsuma]
MLTGEPGIELRFESSRRTRRFAQSISFEQDSTVRARLDGSRRTRRFAQVSKVRAGLDGSRKTRRFSQTELDGSRRTRRVAQDSTVRAGLDGSRRTRRFSQTELDGSRRTRRFAQDSTVRAGLDGSRRSRRFAQVSTVRARLDGSRRQNSTVRAGLDGSRRTRRFAQDSTVRAELDGSRRQNSTVPEGLDGSRRTRPFWPLRRLLAATAPHSRAPANEILIQYLVKAWGAIPSAMIEYSYKKCRISNNGTDIMFEDFCRCMRPRSAKPTTSNHTRIVGMTPPCRYTGNVLRQRRLNYVYWTEWGTHARVARRTISSGTVDPVLLASTTAGLDKINALAIDASTNKLYIGDASGTVIESSLDGSSAKQLRYISATHIYSLYAAHDFLWYTDWNAHSLSRVNVKTGYIEVLATGLMRPSQIVVHYDGSVPAACPTDSGCAVGCDAAPGGFECRCPDGEMLSLDKAQCETVVRKYVEVDRRHCAGVIPGLKTNQVCGRKIGSTDVEAVCKAGHGWADCDACPENEFSAGVGKVVCKSCPAGSQASGTGNTRCVCSDNNKVWDWKLNQCKTTTPGQCPVIQMHDDNICNSSSICSEESDCPTLGQKCCSVAGCGSKHCVNPVGLTECVNGGAIYQVGMTFSPNPCTKCRCDFDKTFGDHRYGNAVCSVTDCPTLKCPLDQQETKAGQCCPVCKASTKCPSTVIVELELGEESNIECYWYKPKWTSRQVPKVQFCWKGKDKVQTAKFNHTASGLACTVQVKVIDNISPKIICGPDQTLWTNGEDSRVTLANPTATDNVDISPKITKKGWTTFPIGETVVHYTATDEAGNTATCSVRVTVKKQDAAVQECKVPNPTHASLKCTQDGSKMSCRLECESYYVPGPGSGGNSTFECTTGTWTPAFHDTFTNLACVLKQPQVVTVSVTLQLTVDADQVVFLKASLEDYINHNIISGSTYWNRIKQIIVIKGQDRRTRRTKRAIRDMDVKMELYITLKDGDDKEDMKSELGKLSRNLKAKLPGDIESNKMKLVADGDNSAVNARHVQSTQAALGCLPGEQQINDYCVVCPVGTFYKSDQKKCVLCKKDTFQELEGETQCRSCPANTRAESGSYVQTQCIAKHTKVPKPSPLPVTVIIGAAIGALVLIIIVIIIIGVCKRRNSSQDDEAAQTRGGREAHTNEAYYMQSLKSDEDTNEYDDIPAD